VMGGAIALQERGASRGEQSRRDGWGLRSPALTVTSNDFWPFSLRWIDEIYCFSIL
jgi:hypothetical protein